MKIKLEGTKLEIERAKAALNSTCLFDSEFCVSDIKCDECERKQGLKIEYIAKEE